MLSIAAATFGLQNGLAPTGAQLRSKVQMSRFTGVGVRARCPAAPLPCLRSGAHPTLPLCARDLLTVTPSSSSGSSGTSMPRRRSWWSGTRRRRVALTSHTDNQPPCSVAGGSHPASRRPSQTRGYDNFNPFERDSVGNACDPNGKFPGETAYKDPKRADTNFAQMQADRVTMEEIKKDPKMSITGKPGNWKFGWDKGLGVAP